jgi:carboxyl-terminal processing protease
MIIIYRSILLFALLFTCTVAFGQDNFPAPQYIPPACQRKPLTRVPKEVALAELATAKSNPPIRSEEQLKLFDALTRIIRENYVYPDFNGLNWTATVTEFRSRILDGLQTDEFYTMMEQLVARLGDRHSRFDSPVKVAADKITLSGNNSYVGIGALFQPLLDKKLITILAVLPGSAAEQSGLQPHDDILAVDGLPIVSEGKFYQQRIRGPECSASVFTVQSPGGTPRRLTLVRYQIQAPAPVYARLVKTPDSSRIGYIFLPSFFDLTIPDQIKKALTDFGTLDGLIIDNRMNSGGSSKVLFPVLGYFASGNLGHFVSRTGRRALEISAEPVGNSQRIPLVVLVSKNTVSYGEVFSGVLQDIGRARIVGEATAGRVETLHGHNFSDGSQAWIAEEGFDPLNSHVNWQRRGVTPDIEVHADWDTFNFENDPAVAAASRLLRKK